MAKTGVQIGSMRHVGMVLFLLALCAGCTSRRNELTPLVDAARRGQAGQVRALCAQGANPDQPSGGNDWTPLFHAVHKNQPDSAAALIEAGATVDRATDSGMTPLMMAAGYGSTDMVKVLLAHGANPGLRDADGAAAVDYALTGMTDIDDFTWFRCQTETTRLLARVSPPATDGARRWSHLKRCT